MKIKLSSTQGSCVNAVITTATYETQGEKQQADLSKDRETPVCGMS